jgi:hypothetical protein
MGVGVASPSQAAALMPKAAAMASAADRETPRVVYEARGGAAGGRASAQNGQIVSSTRT